MNTKSLLSRLATVSFALLGLSLLSKPALAYEEDTHFTITFVQCRAAGMTDAEALTVATYDQGMDDSQDTNAHNGPIPYINEEQLWHAIPYGGSVTDIFARRDVLWGQVISEQDPQKKLQRLGIFFHYQQDIWAHRHHQNHSATDFTPYSVPLGHALDGHQPDRPPFDPVCALRCVEDGMGYAKTYVSTVLHRTPNALFNNYQPASGQQDSNWVDSRKGKNFNQLALDNSTPARAFLTGLIRAQIGAYSSSFDPRYVSVTADEVKYAVVQTKLTAICATQGIVIPASRTPLTTLRTAQLLGGSIGNQTYTVKVHTGDVRYGGTDSNIFLSVDGTKGSFGNVRLNPMISGNAFERNETNTVSLVNYPDVGELTGMTIRSDDKFAGSDWYLGWVEISAPGMATKKYTLNNWIQKGKLTRTLH